MGLDLLLGRTRRNWARDAVPKTFMTVAVIQTSITDETDFKLTPAEMTMLADLSAAQIKARAGNRQARKKLAKLSQEIAKLRVRASRGDENARRALRVFEESGVFRGTQTFALGESEREISNLQYRACVLKQARKSAQVSGRSVPTTKDFFLAKRAVDRTMSDSGISLYLPGSRPGRITY